MNQIDINFLKLVNEIKGLSEKELYYKMRASFDKINLETKESMINFFNKFLYWGKIEQANNCYEEIELKAKELKEHIKEFEDLYLHLEDYRSKKLLYAILNNWYCYDFKTLVEVQEKCYDDYFDLDLIPDCKNEIVVDLGAYTGDSVLSFIRNYGVNCYKKIYAYEITPETYQVLINNLKDYPNINCFLKAAGNVNGSVYVENSLVDASANTLIVDEIGNIPMVTLDDDIKEKITIIKADIEGFEKEALIGAQKHIKEDHPILLFSVYHKNEDLWKIPKMIREIDDTYKFYLRYHGGSIYPTEITLIAI